MAASHSITLTLEMTMNEIFNMTDLNSIFIFAGGFSSHSSLKATPNVCITKCACLKWILNQAYAMLSE